MEHIAVSLLIGLASGLLAFYSGGKAVQSKAAQVSDATKFAKYLRESKEAAFALVAGFSLWLPVLYGVINQSDYMGAIFGLAVWCIVVTTSAIYWYKRYPIVFQRSR